MDAGYGNGLRPMENWKTGKLENWKTGKLENWKKFAGLEPTSNSCSLNYFVILKSEARANWGSLEASRILKEIPYCFPRQPIG